MQLFLKTTSLIWYLGVLAILLVGWSIRDYRYFVAESGIGYWLGIIGGVLMLLVVIYPLRKRFRKWSSIGSVKAWFRLHMILGVVGPVLIIYHSGYRLGSFNSSVALFCMLLVAGSGFIGRYFYSRVHHGLYGTKIRFEEFYSDIGVAELLESGATKIDPAIAGELETLERELTHRHTGVNRSLRFYRAMRYRVRKLRRAIRGSGLDPADKRHLIGRLAALQSICRLGINEILFSYWHVLHLPLFVMMILSAIVHIVAVHLY